MLFLTRRSLTALTSTTVVTVLLTGGLPLDAQEKAATKSTAAKATPTAAPVQSEKTSKTGRVAPPDATHRVPPGYAKLGLTDQQKEKIYKIQAEYYPQIQSLEKQVDAVRAKREKEFEAVLTREQKRLLAEQGQQKKAASEARKAAAISAKIAPAKTGQ